MRGSGSLRAVPVLTASAPTGASGRGHADADLLTEPGPARQVEVIAGPELARVVVVRRPVLSEQPHGLHGAGDHLGAIRLLDRCAPAQPAAEPAPRERRGR